LIFLVFGFSSLFINSQSIKRVGVNGIVFSTKNDVVGVTIFNTSSNKGAITNENGEFNILVSVNDVIEISALQFNTVSIKVDKTIIESKILKIQLVEEINQLDAVTLLSGLTGSIVADMNNVKTVEPIIIDMGNINVVYEYNDDRAFDNNTVVNDLKSITNKGEFYNGVDFIKIFNLFSKPKKYKNANQKDLGHVEPKKVKDLIDIYSSEYISDTYKIPLDHVMGFIVFLEKEGVKPELFKPENELKLIDFLVNKSKEFLKLNNAKN